MTKAESSAERGAERMPRHFPRPSVALQYFGSRSDFERTSLRQTLISAQLCRAFTQSVLEVDSRQLIYCKPADET